MNPRLPAVGDIWCFNSLGRDFYYLVTQYNTDDPLYFGADSATLLSFTEGEKRFTREGISKMVADTRRWQRIA